MIRSIKVIFRSIFS